jgi:hypothetical protein
MRLLGLYEREITASLGAFAKLANCALDIGADDGWYTLYFASRANISRVYAFEPCTASQEKLLLNLEINRQEYRDKINLVRKAVGPTSDELHCSIDEAYPCLPSPLLIKIDVDGAELSVLRGAQRTLEQGCTFLVVETHSQQLEQACIDYVARLGYQTQVVRSGWYRCLLPETRPVPHNRWFVARRPPEDFPPPALEDGQVGIRDSRA